MEKLLETYNLARMNHKEIENLNRLITGRQINSVIKNLAQRKPQNQMASLMYFNKRLKNYIFLNLFQKK